MCIIIVRIAENITPQDRTDMVSVIAGKVDSRSKVKAVRTISEIRIHDEIIIGKSLLGDEVSLFIENPVNNRSSHQILRK